MEIALIGNPNTGKTSLFNTLTGSSEHVGNWHGVTVDSKAKTTVLNGHKVTVVDLPGTYSLSAFSFEEQVTAEYIYQHIGRSSFFNICDINNLNRNLYLTLQLLECGIKPVLLVNFYDEAKKRGRVLDLKKLSALLGVEVLPVNANKKRETRGIFVVIASADPQRRTTKQSSGLFGAKTPFIRHCEKGCKPDEAIQPTCTRLLRYARSDGAGLPYFSKLPLKQITNIIGNNAQNSGLNADFCAIKLLEQDEYILELLNLSEIQKQKIKQITGSFDFTLIAKLRYEYIDNILKQAGRNEPLYKFPPKIGGCPERGGGCDMVYGKYKIDKILLNKYLALPIFLLLMCFIFFVTFSSVGAYLSEFIKFLINKLIGLPLNTWLISANAPLWVIDMVSVGLISGVGGLLSFLPQIVLLFLFLSILEDSGYLARLAFVLEDLFKKVGLTGKSVFTLLMGFGCATTAIITSRGNSDPNAKIKTAMITPYMSCSAKLPLYAVIGGCFFGVGNIFVVFIMYAVGVIVALTVSVILEKTILKSKEQNFFLEFPPYRCPSAKRILKVILENCKLFVIRVGTFLLSLNIIVWVLQSFSFGFVYIPAYAGQQSMLEVLGRVFAPVLAPIGLNNWGIAASLIVGVLSKEMVVSSIAIINNVPAGTNFNAMMGATVVSSASIIHFDPLTAVVCMLFVLLYCPCVSTMGVMKKEIGKKYTLLSFILQLFIAYAVCLIVYNLGRLFILSWGYGLFAVLGAILIAFSVFYVFRCIKNKKTCGYCRDCSGCTGCNKAKIKK